MSHRMRQALSEIRLLERLEAAMWGLGWVWVPPEVRQMTESHAAVEGERPPQALRAIVEPALALAGRLDEMQRRWLLLSPRQRGVARAKALGARALPESGSRFGGRDHTTVLHAIRKSEGEITKNPRLEEELEELKKLLNH